MITIITLSGGDLQRFSSTKDFDSFVREKERTKEKERKKKKEEKI